MASTFKLSTILQNSFSGSAVRAPIAHSVPPINVSLANQWSVAAEFTANTAANITIGSGVLSITVNGVAQLDPITRATIIPARVLGYIISVAGPANGSVAVACTGFGKITFSSINVGVGGVLNIYNPNAGNSSATADVLTITPPAVGYTVSVVAYGSTVAI
tara:strand:+ start:294 stop:776 length:483 start_codon:yes stop_codon:yes gene_type:complete